MQQDEKKIYPNESRTIPLRRVRESYGTVSEGNKKKSEIKRKREAIWTRRNNSKKPNLINLGRHRIRSALREDLGLCIQGVVERSH